MAYIYAIDTNGMGAGGGWPDHDIQHFFTQFVGIQKSVFTKQWKLNIKISTYRTFNFSVSLL